MATSKQPVNFWTRNAGTQGNLSYQPVSPAKAPEMNSTVVDKPKFTRVFGRGRFMRSIPTISVTETETQQPPKVAPYERESWRAPRVPSINTQFYAQLALFDSDGYIHIRSDALLAQFKEYQDKWQTEFEACDNLQTGQLHHGVPCLVKYTEDEKWYRATYLGLRNHLRHVFYEDFGTVDVVADANYKALDAKRQPSYEIPTTIFICRLAHPIRPLEYAVLSADDSAFLRNFVKNREIDVEIVAYQSLRLHGRQRVVLLIDAWTLEEEGEENLVDAVMQRNPNLEFRQTYTVPVTFDSEPHFRSCSVLQFPSAHNPPMGGEKILVKIQKIGKNKKNESKFFSEKTESNFFLEKNESNFFSEENESIFSFVSVSEKNWKSSASSLTKMIYGDASILAAMEKDWTKEEEKLIPAEIVNEDNSYLVRFGESICRAEVLDLLEFDQFLIPTKVEVFLIDRGIQFVVDAEKVLDFPKIISVQVAKQAFWAEICLSKPDVILDPDTTADDYEFVDTVEKVEDLVGKILTVEFFESFSEKKLCVRLFVEKAKEIDSSSIDWYA